MGRTSREKSGRRESGPAANPKPANAHTMASAAPKRTAGKAHPQTAGRTHQPSFILRYFSGAASDSGRHSTGKTPAAAAVGQAGSLPADLGRTFTARVSR